MKVYAIQGKSVTTGKWIAFRLGGARGKKIYMEKHQYHYYLQSHNCIDGVHYRAVPVS